MSSVLTGVGSNLSRLRERVATARAERSGRGTEADPVEVHVDPGSVVPDGYRATSEYAWRFLVMVGAVAVVLWVATKISLVVIAVLVAVLVAALLSPLNIVLRRAGMSRGAAAATAFLGGIAVIAALGWFITAQLVAGFGDLQDAVTSAVDDLTTWVQDGPLNAGIDIATLRQEALDLVESNRQEITSRALGILSAVSQFFAGLALTLFTAFFLLYDGRRIWLWSLRLLPRHLRADADAAATHGWATLVGYVRGTCIVAFVDALFIGIGLVVLDVPLAVPLAVLVFLGAFVPLVGATVTGALACLVALATNGVVTALLVLVVILVVQQVEGNVLQPFLLGKLVALHPLAIVLAVAAGSLIAGISGAVFSVPLVAVVNAVGSTLAERTRARRAGKEPPPLSASAAGTGSVEERGEQDRVVELPPQEEASTVPPLRQ